MCGWENFQLVTFLVWQSVKGRTFSTQHNPSLDACTRKNTMSETHLLSAYTHKDFDTFFSSRFFFILFLYNFCWLAVADVFVDGLDFFSSPSCLVVSSSELDEETENQFSFLPSEHE